MGISGFTYGARLLPSLWQRQQAYTIEFYLDISNDGLLHGFRTRAGLPAPGEPLTGWYGEGASTFGQILGALSKLYVATGDPRLKEKALVLVHEWAKTMGPDGEGSFPAGNTSPYVYEKTLGGLVDVYEYLGLEEAVDCAEKLTRWAKANLRTDIKRDGDQDQVLCDANMIEWYTLPENLLRAFQLTGRPLFREFAEEWEYDHMWDMFADGRDEMEPRHAYSQVNSLSSAARAYLAKGERKYLDAAVNGHDIVTGRHTFATGGYGPAETLFGEEGYLGDSLKNHWDGDRSRYRSFNREDSRNDAWGSCEVPCCSWAVFKLCHYLLTITGQARFGDWVEKLLYNGMGAQLPIAPGGKVQYYHNYFLDGGLKTVEDRRLSRDGANFEWQCCTGTLPQNVAEYNNLLYYRDEQGLYVSQYLPSSVDFPLAGQSCRLTNVADLTREQRAVFQLECEHPVTFTLRLRVPAWVGDDARVLVNGEAQEIPLTPNEWLELRREWRGGDVVTLETPFHLRFQPVDRVNATIMALCCGPLVLACDELCRLKGDSQRPAEWIRCIDREELVFETLPGHDAAYPGIVRRFRPYYRIPEMTWYYMYLEVTAQ